MDPVKSYLGRLLLEELTPVVMVLTTPHVEDACQKNGLNFIEMLLPFSLFKKIDVPVRTAADQPYRLQMFKLRLIYATDIQQKNYEAAEHHLKQVVSDSSEKALPDLLSDPPQLETVLSKSESDLCPQWIQLFNKELIRTVSFSEHESFDHPVACLLVVSSKDEQPINRFVDLFNTDQLPSLLNDGVMDPKILKHYLLLHDNQDGAPENASRILAEMRSTFGPNDCRLLCINSAQGEDINREDISWLPYKPHGLHGHEIACSLNIDDLNGIKDFMQRLASNHIIPYMEQKIRVLNQQVSATRKGFRNQIKNLWWRKGKDDTPEAPHGPMYTFNSIESQIRVLGDYAFMLRDYELALSNYRLLSTDYKLDKSWKCYAGVQEMSGLSYFMLDQSRKESEYCMENALSTYLRIGSSCQRNATRCGLWWAEMLKARGQHKEASTVYFRISSEEPSLLAAVMLEQASCCYLLSNPPMLRKYGFHLILAGNRYYISDQRQHAIRAYRNALFVYKGNGWSYINDHVHFNIGRWYGLLGSFEVAVKHMLEVLACSQQSSVTQNIFLSDFFSVVQSMGKTFDVYRLQLPTINMSSLKVVYEDHRTYASASDVGVSESFWQVLEEEMVPPGSTIRTNWLESQPKSSLLKKYNDSCVCVAGEAVKVDLELTNPLQISISVSGISLICEISSSFEASDIDTSASSVAVKEDTGFENPSSCRDPNGENYLFTISKLDVVLGGGETKRVSSFDEICERHVLYKGVISTILAARKYYQFLVDVTSDGKRVYHSSFLDKVETCNDITDWFHSVVENAKKIQLEVTPKVEGILKLVGVRWTLSDSVVGFQYFELDTKKKKKKEKKGARQSLSSNLSLIVIKGIPKVEGYIDCMPTKAFAGDLRLVTLKLRNHSEYSVKNMKMKISHPRFLVPSSSPDLDLDFPRCLEKKGNLESKHVSANTKDVFKNLLFSFPKDAIIQGGAAFSWPLWFHAGLSGSISLYISLYYEIESCSSDMTYRTLRMRYNLEVLPSLDISFSVSPCSSRLQEYLVHMDILNRTSLESFVLHQLSCVSDQWTISTLPSCASICSTQTISAGQGLSCFFKLKDLRTSSSEKSNYTDKKSDVLIDSEGSKDLLIDVCGSPLTQFHHQERHHQGKLPKVYPGLLDFILISKKIESDSNPGPEANQQLFSNHACHCSITSKSPIWWLMEGPQTINHDFSDSHCEVNLHVTIYNCTGNIVSVRLATSDNIPETSQSNDTTQSPDYSSNGGWHDISLANDIKLMTTAQVSRPQKPALECTPPFFWCAASSTQLNVAPACTSKVPVIVGILAPGTYNLSNYELHWKLQPSEGGLADEEKIWSSGVGRGHPFYLTAVHDPR